MEISKFIKWKFSLEVPFCVWNFCGKFVHPLWPTYSQFPTKIHDCLTYFLVTKTHFRLRCDSYHIFSHCKTVRNPHNRWHYPERATRKHFEKVLISWSNWTRKHKTKFYSKDESAYTCLFEMEIKHLFTCHLR